MSEHELVRKPVTGALGAPFLAPPAPAALRSTTPSGEIGASCRLGDASCASAHASGISRRMTGGATSLQRSLLDLQRDYGNRFVGQVLRQASGQEGAGTGGMDAIERSIEAARGGGNDMDHGTRQHMESSFGADFSGVRIHTDSRADGLSHALAARAFTTGQDVFFRQGEYSPGTSGGRELLAHELTHVMQQTGGVQRKMTVSQPGDPHEMEADQMARAVIAAEHAPQADRRAIAREEQSEEQVATKRAADALQRQPEAPKPQDDEEKKELHTKPDRGVVGIGTQSNVPFDSRP